MRGPGKLQCWLPPCAAVHLRVCRHLTVELHRFSQNLWEKAFNFNISFQRQLLPEECFDPCWWLKSEVCYSRKTCACLCDVGDKDGENEMQLWICSLEIFRFAPGSSQSEGLFQLVLVSPSQLQTEKYASLPLWWLNSLNLFVHFFAFILSTETKHLWNVCFYSNIDCGVTMDKKL